MLSLTMLTHLTKRDAKSREVQSTGKSNTLLLCERQLACCSLYNISTLFHTLFERQHCLLQSL
uniref:Uncharacterized protein n=1 Tax=Helianthus annuus TaxID=4232 RepID=A0A251TI59_HELAN